MLSLNTITLKFIWILASILLIPTLTNGEEFRLEYRSAEFDYKEAGSNRIRLDRTEIPPEGVAIPDIFEGKRCFYSCWSTKMAPHEKVWIAILSSDDGPFDYNHLYVDTDCDYSLADESPIESYKTEGQWSLFKPVAIRLKNDLIYHIDLGFFKYKDYEGFYAGSAAWYEGSVKINNQVYSCKLIDYNFNGLFNDISMISNEQDRIMVNNETFILGKYIRFKDVFYHIEPSTNGDFISFRPVDKKSMGFVKFEDNITLVTLDGVNGRHRFIPNKGIISIPAGRWIIKDWRIEKKDRTGSSWTACGSESQKLYCFDLLSGKEKAVDIGEPFISELITEKKYGMYSFKENLNGRLGEKIVIEHQGRPAPPPKLFISNEDETFAILLDFEYG